MRKLTMISVLVNFYTCFIVFSVAEGAPRWGYLAYRQLTAGHTTNDTPLPVINKAAQWAPSHQGPSYRRGYWAYKQLTSERHRDNDVKPPAAQRPSAPHAADPRQSGVVYRRLARRRIGELAVIKQPAEWAPSPRRAAEFAPSIQAAKHAYNVELPTRPSRPPTARSGEHTLFAAEVLGPAAAIRPYQPHTYNQYSGSANAEDVLSCPDFDQCCWNNVPTPRDHLDFNQVDGYINEDLWRKHFSTDDPAPRSFLFLFQDRTQDVAPNRTAEFVSCSLATSLTPVNISFSLWQAGSARVQVCIRPAFVHHTIVANLSHCQPADSASQQRVQYTIEPQQPFDFVIVVDSIDVSHAGVAVAVANITVEGYSLPFGENESGPSEAESQCNAPDNLWLKQKNVLAEARHLIDNNYLSEQEIKRIQAMVKYYSSCKTANTIETLDNLNVKHEIYPIRHDVVNPFSDEELANTEIDDTPFLMGDVLPSQEMMGQLITAECPAFPFGLPRAHRQVLTNSSHLWPRGESIYIQVKGSGRNDDSFMRNLNEAIKKLNSVFCVRLQIGQWPPGKHRLLIDSDGAKCMSFIGRQLGTAGGNPWQIIQLNYKGCNRVGTMIHELMHALGMEHEQSRSDREQFIEIDETKADETRLANFYEYNSENFRISGEYNYLSIMHYTPVSFCRTCDQNPPVFQSVIRTKDPRFRRSIGQRNDITFADLKRLCELYKCAERCPELDCGVGYQTSRDCGVCQCPLGVGKTGSCYPGQVTYKGGVYTSPVLGIRQTLTIQRLGGDGEMSTHVISAIGNNRAVRIGIKPINLTPDAEDGCFNEGIIVRTENFHQAAPIHCGPLVNDSLTSWTSVGPTIAIQYFSRLTRNCPQPEPCASDDPDVCVHQVKGDDPKQTDLIIEYWAVEQFTTTPASTVATTTTPSELTEDEAREKDCEIECNFDSDECLFRADSGEYRPECIYGDIYDEEKPAYCIETSENRTAVAFIEGVPVDSNPVWFVVSGQFSADGDSVPAIDAAWQGSGYAAGLMSAGDSIRLTAKPLPHLNRDRLIQAYWTASAGVRVRICCDQQSVNCPFLSPEQQSNSSHSNSSWHPVHVLCSKYTSYLSFECDYDKEGAVADQIGLCGIDSVRLFERPPDFELLNDNNYFAQRRTDAEWVQHLSLEPLQCPPDTHGGSSLSIQSAQATDLAKSS